MDALKFLKERKRMCEHYLKKNCHGCPRDDKPCGLGCRFDYKFYQEYIDDVVKWSKDHPQRTRLQDFLGKYPDAAVHPDGQPVICCARLGYQEYCEKGFGSDACFLQCQDCWNMPVEEDGK